MALRLLTSRTRGPLPLSAFKYRSNLVFNPYRITGQVNAGAVRCFSVDMMKLEMPALSPTMSEGTVAKWLKKEGDKVDVGDVLCEIQTDKATVGYESQEEGYIAKILSEEGSASPIGGLIGVMVEEEEDIAKVDLSSLKAQEPVAPKETAPVTEPVAAAPAQPAKPAASSSTAGAASAVGTEDFMKELERMIHDGQYKVAPSAGFYMRTYGVLPSEVPASGPKGYIQKGDVLDFVEKNKLVKGQIRSAPATAAPAAPKKPAAQKPKSASKAQSNAYDPSQPFKQSWQDQALADGYDQVAQNISNQKRYVAHTYMSSKCDVTAITAQVNLLNESSVTFESFVLRAASRAFTKAFPEVETQNIARVVQDSEELGVKIHERANESRMSDFASQELAAGVYGHDSGEAISACPLTITHVRNSTESLPIVNHAALISLHFTQPRTEVIHGGLVPGQTFDIETLEDEDLNYDLSLKVAQTAKISISYDIQKVDDIQAGKYMQYLKTFLDDPELMLL